MLLVVKVYLCYNCIVIKKEYWNEYRKSLGIVIYLYAIFETSREELYSEDKVIKALEKKSIKEWITLSTIKTRTV